MSSTAPRERRAFGQRMPARIAFAVMLSLGPASTAASPGADAPGAPVIREWTLDQCLESALENNRRRPVSRFAVAAAEAQHRQALAGYWPQVRVSGGYLRLDESPNFYFPPSTITIDLGGGPLNFPVPAQDVTLQDPDSYVGSAGLTWLLWDGGMRSGYRQQARGQVDLRRAEARRTDLEIVETVQRYYYGAVLARQLRELGSLTLERLEATLRLTETMYREGSGRVKKTDYLQNRVMVESIRSMVAVLEKNESLAQAALANAAGLGWQESVRPAADSIPYVPVDANLAALVDTAYVFNPDWQKLQAGLEALEGGVRTARSGYFPRVALTGDLHRWWNGLDSGLATERNRSGWTAGVMLDLPLFDGFLTSGRVAEARARWNEVREQGVLLHEGLGLMIKDVVLGIDAAQKQYQATGDAAQSATENRDLNTRAYQNELVETQDVIQAQLVEALMLAQHDKVLYDHLTLRARLDFIVGTEVTRRLGGAR